MSHCSTACLHIANTYAKFEAMSMWIYIYTQTTWYANANWRCNVSLRTGMMVGINAPYYTVGYQAVRLVDGVQQNYSMVNEFPTGRWYPSVMTLSNGNMLVVGGAQIVSFASQHAFLYCVEVQLPDQSFALLQGLKQMCVCLLRLQLLFSLRSPVQDVVVTVFCSF